MKNKNKNITESKYIRPKYTYTDLLTHDDIKNLLQDYKYVTFDELDQLKFGDHVRYFSKINDKFKFRNGGVVIYLEIPKYIRLSNWIIKWSVNLETNIIFVRKTIDEQIFDINNELIINQKQLIQIQKKISNNVKMIKMPSSKFINNILKLYDINGTYVHPDKIEIFDFFYVIETTNLLGIYVLLNKDMYDGTVVRMYCCDLDMNDKQFNPVDYYFIKTNNVKSKINDYINKFKY